MQKLPAELLQPLPIIPTWFFLLFKSLLIIILVATVLIWLFYKFRDKKLIGTKHVAVEATPRTEQNTQYSEILDTINRIKFKYKKSEKFRDGLHELSSTLKTYFENKLGFEIEEMTPTEIQATIDRKNITALFQQMSFLQFGRNEPKEDDFLSIIELTRKTIKEFKSYLRKRR
ncbi:MAG: hypothetical protein AAF518_13150 [Spirochaetota bacterium]